MVLANLNVYINACKMTGSCGCFSPSYKFVWYGQSVSTILNSWIKSHHAASFLYVAGKRELLKSGLSLFL